MRQIVLLRGINLGSRNRIAMPRLRELLTAAGFDDVRTYVQSGNVVLSSDLAPDALAESCRRTVAAGAGLDVPVLTRTRDELAEAIARNPLGDVAENPKRHQVVFLSEELASDQLERLAARAAPSERLAAIGRELYTWHPEGIARSKLWASVAGQGLGVTATARNWTTVTSLLALADE